MKPEELINEIKQSQDPNAKGEYARGWDCGLDEACEIIREAAKHDGHGPDMAKLEILASRVSQALSGYTKGGRQLTADEYTARMVDLAVRFKDTFYGQA